MTVIDAAIAIIALLVFAFGIGCLLVEIGEYGMPSDNDRISHLKKELQRYTEKEGA